ncbi:MAG: hypothetical protein LBH86_05355, partial [Oscillospiraceae bacterium]|nr:hypothetical protein [Oscillospiraceae bacterium]
VVAYELEVIKLPFVGPIEIQFAQSASTRGWLGGDETIVPQPAPSESPSPEQPEQKEESIWTQSNFVRGRFFKDLLKSTYSGTGIVTAKGTQSPYAYDENTNTFYHCVSINTFSASYNPNGNFDEAEAGKTAVRAMNTCLKKIDGKEQLTMEDDSVKNIDQSRPKHVECLVIIPEDASPEAEAALRQILNNRAQEHNASGSGETVSYRLARGGGNAKPAETPAQEAA